jgi:superfamily II DNA or RNA helicase
MQELIGRRVRLAGHFAGTVRLEAAERLEDSAFKLRVRTDAGLPDETVVTDDELDAGIMEPLAEQSQLVPGDELFDFVEARRIELAYAHDPTFAVSLSGIRGLPHQIEAVYKHMLPQARLRFVLADDPGAGKTIMAGLLMKELHLRGVVDRVLVLCPAPLTVQWQGELLDKFDERFEVLDSHKIRWQLGGNAWQQTSRAITSLDFAKREEILPDLLLADWDLVIVDEAHKCSATTRWDPAEQRDKLDRTRRYTLAEELAKRTERLLLMTATPHSGDPARFQCFLRLLDPDQFAIQALASEQIAADDSPYFLRRQKEGLRDERGAPLFVKREVLRREFELSPPELQLYEAVTAYIQQFLGQTGGQRGNAVALARTVLQRRLASSLGAIRSSLNKRAARIGDRIREVESLPAPARAAKLAEFRLIPDFDSEQDPDDVTEESESAAVEGVVVAETLDAMRIEVKELERLIAQADAAIDSGEESKLAALRECLDSSELRSMHEDGRAKLLIFTEHRDTLDYLERNLREWGYSTCVIHGGQPPTARKEIQQQFHQDKQICIATEAAGEGINLQFCHLMINYDLPWNPVRLEQRMGRIHRIGQEAKCVIFNFCAVNTIEGHLIALLLLKLEEMRKALGGRVYDVLGEVLQHNGLDFERLVRDALLNPSLRDPASEQIKELTADALLDYERMVGVAQATKNVDMSWVREHDWTSEERRLMPEYVESFFRRACQQLDVRLERRVDGLWRIEHVPQALRSDRLSAVQRLDRPQKAYRKLTFLKEQRARAEHEDAVLLSPGHPLFAAVNESLREKLAAVEGASAVFAAPWAVEPYAIHFFLHSVTGLATSGKPEVVFAEIAAVVDTPGGGFERAPADVLHDLTPVDQATPGESLKSPDNAHVRSAEDFLRLRVQQPRVAQERAQRLKQAEVRSAYLVEALDAESRRLESSWLELDHRVSSGEENARIALDAAVRRREELGRRREEKLRGFEQLGIVKPGPVAYLGSALIVPPEGVDDEAAAAMRNDPEVELAAMGWAMAEERREGWDPDDVSQARDGSGFDIRSVLHDEQGRVVDVRRIEVKGRAPHHGDVSLCRTEWIAARRHGEKYWLYVIYGAKSGSPRGIKIRDPYARLHDQVRKVTQVTSFYIPGAAIEAAA